jgi:predicted amidohydrolase
MIRIAAAAYHCEFLPSWAAWQAKLSRAVADAAAGGAQLLVFPEWAGLELATLREDVQPLEHSEAIALQTERLAAADRLHAALAAEYGVHICAGSAMVLDQHGRAVNRARLIAPNGTIGVQDKLIMTRYEREQLDLQPGRDIHVFDTALGRIGIAICYDIEFPLITRAMIEAGAEIILAPSCTETLAGYWRVRLGAQARAMEGQCVTVQAPTIGAAAWSDAIDLTTGAAGIYAPPDVGFPASGVLAIGEIDRAGWVFADVDLAQIKAVRTDGGVLHVRHWPEQDGRLAAVQPVDLRSVF